MCGTLNAPWVLTPRPPPQALALALPAALGTTGSYQLTYVEFFSGVGANWGPTTSSAFVTALEATYASAGVTSMTVAPVDFPVAMGVTMLGVHLYAFNQVPHLQDRVQAAIGTDAGVNGTSQVNLGAFTQTPAGLYLPFTVDNLGSNPATAAGVVNTLFTSGELITTSSALSTTLANAGINCALAWGPPTGFPANQPNSPSTGVQLSITALFPNASAATAAVAVNLMDTGLLLQELTANGVTLGVLYGGAVVQVHTVTITPPSGVPVAAYQQVFLASETSPAPSAVAGKRAGLFACAAAVVAALAALL